MIRHPTHNQGDAAKAFGNAADIAENARQIGRPHRHARGFDVKHQVNVDFDEGAGHVLPLFMPQCSEKSILPPLRGLENVVVLPGAALRLPPSVFLPPLRGSRGYPSLSRNGDHPGFSLQPQSGVENPDGGEA